MTDHSMLTDIIKGTASNRDRAHECLRHLDTLPTGDLARPDLRAAAQAFATLHLADTIDSVESFLRSRS